MTNFDLIVIGGDTSLDHWEHNGGGSYLKDGVTTTKAFMEKYVSQLPAAWHGKCHPDAISL